jgi:phage gpG-like protein
VLAFSLKVLQQPELSAGLVTRRITHAGWNRTLEAMGAKLILITRQNFGSSGPNRSSDWKSLSKRYAKKVGRSYATLDVTGKLFRSFRMTTAAHRYVIVKTTGIPYASAHQFGRNNMPWRPFFPIDRYGQLTSYARREVTKAAVSELIKFLK